MDAEVRTRYRAEVLSPAAEELADYDDLDELLELRCRINVSSR